MRLCTTVTGAHVPRQGRWRRTKRGRGRRAPGGDELVADEVDGDLRVSRPQCRFRSGRIVASETEAPNMDPPGLSCSKACPPGQPGWVHGARRVTRTADGHPVRGLGDDLPRAQLREEQLAVPAPRANPTHPARQPTHPARGLICHGCPLNQPSASADQPPALDIIAMGARAAKRRQRPCSAPGAHAKPPIGSRFFGERYMSTIWFRKNN